MPSMFSGPPSLPKPPPMPKPMPDPTLAAQTLEMARKRGAGATVLAGDLTRKSAQNPLGTGSAPTKSLLGA